MIGKKLEAIILKCNLFRIYWGRSTAFIYSCSSLIYSRGTYKTYTRKYFGLTKYPQKKLLTHKIPTRKKFDPWNSHEKKFWTHEIPTRKNFGPSKTRWRDGARPTRPTMARGPRNLAHSIIYMIWLVRITYTYKYTCILKKHIQTLHRYTAPYIVKHTETLPRLQKLHDHLQQHEVRDKYLLIVFRYHVQLEKCDLNYISTNFYKTR